MKRCIAALMLVCASASVLSLPAFSEGLGFGPWQGDSDWSHNHPFQVTPLSSIAVPGTSAANPFKSFDIIYVEPKTQLMALTSRSSKAVAIYNASDDTALGMTPAVFAGVGVDSAHSGPNGAVIAGYQLWAGDYPSTVRVFDLRTSLSSPTQIAAI